MRKLGVPRQGVPNRRREPVPGVKLFRSAFPSLLVSEVLRENVLREKKDKDRYLRFRRRSYFSIQPIYAALGAVGFTHAAEAPHH
jgi:hypothetical protein